mmetsp:Transcript_3501/g.5681  ORF Transcript_3501/g.5681 Transcript_3501/m.5681 type:complete len:169 (-) Transcript_3501:150-656(-)
MLSQSSWTKISDEVCERVLSCFIDIPHVRRLSRVDRRFSDLAKSSGSWQDSKVAIPKGILSSFGRRAAFVKFAADALANAAELELPAHEARMYLEADICKVLRDVKIVRIGLVPGDRIGLDGLVRDTDLNGKQGAVLSVAHCAWVQLDVGQEVAAQPENIVHVIRTGR